MEEAGNNSETGGTPPQKRRSVTSLTLGWLAERLRKSEELKEQVETGQYQVDTEKLAASIANEEG